MNEKLKNKNVKVISAMIFLNLDDILFEINVISIEHQPLEYH